MIASRLWAFASLAVTSSAQFATYDASGHRLAVNVPADTASSGSGSIFFQIAAPSNTQWTAFGQGSSMSGSNMFVVYAASSSNVTVSPRLGKGHFEPAFNSDAQITVLAGSAVNSDGSFVANVRCDNCLSWSGGSMKPTDSSSSWIWAYKQGSAIESTSTSADIQQHDDMNSFSLDLTKAAGGSAVNPFAATSSSGSATTSGSGSSATQTSGSSAPVVSSSPGSSSGGSSSTINTAQVRTAHAVIMSMIFVILLPIGALTMYLPYAKRVRFVHAPVQVLSLILLIVGLALGVILGQRVHELDGYHQVVGFIIVALLVLFQPALGIYQHLHYNRTGGRSPMGIVHKWLGRSVIILGVVNGGLGFMQSGPIGNDNVPSFSVVAYSIVTGVVFVVYMSVVVASHFSSKKKAARGIHEKEHGRGGYEMHSSSTSPQSLTPQRSQHGYGHQTQNNQYASRRDYR